MDGRLPTSEEIEELVLFLPRLYAEGFSPVKRWGGGIQNESGVTSFGYPEYEPVVEEFFRVASGECWDDNGYTSRNAGEMLKDEELIKTADLKQIKTMLTFCVRGERLCDGHWGSMIEEGHIRRLLQRLVELGSNNA